MNKRIKQIRTNYKLTQQQFALQLDLSRNFISQIESGTKKPSERTLKDICKIFNIRYAWLVYGTGEMNEQDNSALSTRIDAIMTGENETAKNIFKAFSLLDNNEWELLDKILKKLSS